VLDFWFSLCSKHSENNRVMPKNANRWVVAGLDHFRDSYSRASAAGFGHGSREGTSSVLALSWLIFLRVGLIFGSVCARNTTKTTGAAKKCEPVVEISDISKFFGF
jgi:hypothetical protein